jgi:hypothetical protein
MLRVSYIILVVIALASLQLLHAQDDRGYESKINSNLAMVVSMPVSSTAKVASTGWGATGGVGYNFNSRNALIGEFLWNRIYPSGGTLQPLQAAVPQSGSLNGNSNLYALTGNYRFELRGRLLGTYLIGGGGWYFRKTWLSRDVNTGSGTICTPTWLWYGFTCASGIVTANQTLASSSTNAWGGNAGIGFTFRVGEAPYRLYTEARYQYAPTKGISTQLMAITVGIRY